MQDPGLNRGKASTTAPGQGRRFSRPPQPQPHKPVPLPAASGCCAAPRELAGGAGSRDGGSCRFLPAGTVPAGRLTVAPAASTRTRGQTREPTPPPPDTRESPRHRPSPHHPAPPPPTTHGSIPAPHAQYRHLPPPPAPGSRRRRRGTTASGASRRLPRASPGRHATLHTSRQPPLLVHREAEGRRCWQGRRRYGEPEGTWGCALRRRAERGGWRPRLWAVPAVDAWPAAELQPPLFHGESRRDGHGAQSRAAGRQLRSGNELRRFEAAPSLWCAGLEPRRAPCPPPLGTGQPKYIISSGQQQRFPRSQCPFSACVVVVATTFIRGKWNRISREYIRQRGGCEANLSLSITGVRTDVAYPCWSCARLPPVRDSLPVCK